MTDTIPEIGVRAARVNLLVNQRASFYGELTWENADGSPKDLSSFSAATLAIAYQKGDDPVITLTLGSGLTLQPSARAGVVAISMTREQTATLSGPGFYDLLLSDGAGNDPRVAEGRVLLDKGVSTL